MATTTTTATYTNANVSYEIDTTVTTTSLLGVVISSTTTYDLKITATGGTQTDIGTVDNVYTSTSTTDVSLSNLLSTETYVVVPGASVDFDVIAGLLSSTTYYIGGSATITSNISAITSMTANVVGGTLTVAQGNLLGALSGLTVNLYYGGSFSNGTSLISLLNGITVNFEGGGGTFVVNAGGAVIDLSSTTINGFDAAKDYLEFEDLSGTVTTYSIVTTAETLLTSAYQTIVLYSSTGATLGTVVIQGTNLTAGSFSVGSGPLTITTAASSDGTINTFVEAVATTTCFLPGTMIETTEGEIAVEYLKRGNLVATYKGGDKSFQEIIWIGQRKARTDATKPDDLAGYPVRVSAGALEEGIPYKDLLLTPEHCLYLEGKFTPVRMLVNSQTIFYDRTYDHYDYYHIETAEHAVIRADGTLSETYLDTGNRYGFTQPGDTASIGHKTRTWADAAAPLATDRATVEPIFNRLAARAATLPHHKPPQAQPLTNDPHLHLMTDDGRTLYPIRNVDGTSIFRLPPKVRSARIVSLTSRPCDTIGPFVDDRRHLGVLIGEITLFNSDTTRKITCHLSDGELPGWDVREQSPCRWTNGAAILPLGERRANSIGLLAIEIICAGPYVTQKKDPLEIAYQA